MSYNFCFFFITQQYLHRDKRQQKLQLREKTKNEIHLQYQHPEVSIVKSLVHIFPESLYNIQNKNKTILYILFYILIFFIVDITSTISSSQYIFFLSIMLQLCRVLLYWCHWEPIASHLSSLQASEIIIINESLVNLCIHLELFPQGLVSPLQLPPLSSSYPCFFLAKLNSFGFFKHTMFSLPLCFCTHSYHCLENSFLHL